MGGKEALRLVLCANTALTTMVPESRIVAGTLPQGIELPAIRLWKVGGSDRNIPNPGPKRRVTQRIQAEVHANNEVEASDVLALVRRAAADTVAMSLGPLGEVVILTAGEGPNGVHPVTFADMETQDFKVSYNETR